MEKMQYKVGDRVKIKDYIWYKDNKDEDGDVPCGEYDFVEDMKKYCSETFTICQDVGDGYLVMEDDKGYVWTDEMIDCLVEEETKPKFKVGDKVITDTNMKGKIIEVVEEYWYRVEFEPHNGIPQPNGVVPEESMSLVEEEIKPKFKVGDKITNGKDTLTILTLSSDRYVVEDTFGECGTLYFNFVDDWKIVEEENLKSREDDIEKDMGEHQKIVDEIMDIQGIKPIEAEMEEVWYCPEGYIFKDENGNIINTTKIVLEKKGVTYPKTYAECCKVLDIDAYDLVLSIDYRSNKMKHKDWKRLEKLNALNQILICRDAYWKLAGEEMGLDGPWEPDYNEESYELGSPIKYVIYYTGTHIAKGKKCTPSYILSFPTEEMRDTFYENFKETIKQCLILLKY